MGYVAPEGEVISFDSDYVVTSGVVVSSVASKGWPLVIVD